MYIKNEANQEQLQTKSTAQRQAEKAIQDSEAHLRAILDNMVDGVITVNGRGIVESFNPAAERIFGYTYAEIIGQNVKVLMPEPYQSEHDTYLNTYLRTGQAKIIGIGREVTGLRKDGSTFPMELAVSEVKLGQQQLFTAIVRDITKPKQAQETIRQSEDQLRSTISSMDDLVFVLDKHGLFTYYYQPLDKAELYAPPELFLGKSFQEILPPPIAKLFEAAIDVVKATHTVRKVDYSLKIMGQELWFSAKVSIRTDNFGQFDGVTIVARNVTERKHSEDALKKNEEYIRTILNNVIDGIITIDEQGIIEIFNPAAELIFGYLSNEVVGQNVNMLMPEPYHTEHDLYLGNYLRTGQTKIIGIGREVIGLRKDGSTFPMELAVSELQLGEQHMFTAIMRDITERKRIEQELHQLNASKDKFFSIIAHDLRSPFTHLLNYSDLLLSIDALDPEEVQLATNTINNSLNNLFKLLENLLQWSIIQMGQTKYQPDQIKLGELITDNVELLRGNAAEKNIRLHYDVKESSFVYADRDMINSVIRNLISNAIKFTNSGGEVKVLVQPKEQFVELAVSDTGVGISQDDMTKLFRIDTQHITYDTANERGTGLGLILCKEFVERNGGQIWVESVVGRGATFSFSIPIAANLTDLLTTG